MDEAVRNLRIDPGEPWLHEDGAPIIVEKVGAHIPVSDDLLMDTGVIPDTRPPVHIPWWRRAHWRIQAWRERVGRKVGGWIAGVDLSDPDDLRRRLR